MKVFGIKIKHGASDVVDVVLNQSNKAAKPNRPRPNGKKKGMVKLGNIQVIRGSKNMSLRYPFNGLS